MVSASLRQKLLAVARNRCCLHRRMWLRVVADDALAKKFEPLHIHHVEFQSCGGSDDESNLVPLCPTCHELLHASRRDGTAFVSDQELREEWERWKSFRDIVPARIDIEPLADAVERDCVLDVYGIAPRVAVGAAVSYAAFRRRLLAALVAPLAQHDPHFPFARGVDASSWQVSTDDAAALPWNQTPVADALRGAPGPISFSAPHLVALTGHVNWRLSRSPQHRGL